LTGFAAALFDQHKAGVGERWISKKWTPMMLSILRIVTGLIFSGNMRRKSCFGFPGPPQGRPFRQPMSLLWLRGGSSKIVCSPFLILGLFHAACGRFSFPVKMAIAYWTFPFSPVNMYPLLKRRATPRSSYCFVFLFHRGCRRAAPPPRSIGVIFRKKGLRT